MKPDGGHVELVIHVLLTYSENRCRGSVVLRFKWGWLDYLLTSWGDLATGLNHWLPLRIDSCWKSARTSGVKFGKRQSKFSFLYYARTYSEPFRHTQENLLFLAILRWPLFFSEFGQQEIQYQTVRRSRFKSSNKWLQMFLDDPHETLLEKLIINY